MKNLVIFLMLMTGIVQLYGQGINYQGVLRNDDGSVMANENVDIAFIIRQNNSPVFSENHSAQTDEYGVLNLMIGSADPIGFEQIEWTNGNASLDILINGNSSGEQTIGAVPFALTTTNMHFDDLIDVDISNVENGDILIYNQGTWESRSLDDQDEQQLDLDGTTLSISNGNSVNLNAITTGGDGWGGQVAQAGAGISGNGTSSDPLRLSSQGASTGEVLKWNGNNWVPDEDENTDTDDQTLNLSGTTLSISQGNSVNLNSITTGGDDWGGQVAESGSGVSGDGTTGDPLRLSSQGASTGEVLKWNGNNWVPEEDENTDTDDQTLNLSGTTLSISQGNSVNLSTITTGGDDWGGQAAQSGSGISGDGTSSDPLRLSSQGASTGEVLKWNGNNWVPEEDEDTDTDDQTLTLNGTTLSISQGNSVNLSTITTGGDDWGGQVAQSGAGVSGNGTSGDPLRLSSQGASAGEVLKWNGNNWVPDEDNFIPNTDDQTLSINGNTLSITNGNSITLPSGGGSGDITAVNTGVGLLGGGSSGAVFIEADIASPIWNANAIQNIPVSISNPEFGQALVFDSGSNQFVNAFQNDGDFFLNPNVPGWGAGLGALYPTNFASGTDANFSNVSGNLIVGNIFGTQIAIDGNEILAKSAEDVAGTLLLQNGGGQVRIGSSSVPNTHILQVSGVARSTQSTWAVSSDRRVKQNVKSMSGSLEKILRLRPVIYDWINQYKKDHPALHDHNLGFIAQEVQQVIPEMVTELEEMVGEEKIADFKSLNMDPLFPHLVQAVQEQQVLIEKQQDQIDVLTKKLNDLLQLRTVEINSSINK